MQFESMFLWNVRTDSFHCIKEEVGVAKRPNLWVPSDGTGTKKSKRGTAHGAATSENV
jgi:hypothetical protein